MSLTAMKRSIPRTQFTRKIQPTNDETMRRRRYTQIQAQNVLPAKSKTLAQKRNIDPISIMVGNPAPDVA